MSVLNRRADPAFAVTALYARLSNDDGIDSESNSITNQKKILKEYADKNGFFNTRYYYDDGATGTNFDRIGFQNMIADIESGEVTTVIVKDLSRLGRNHLLVGYYTENFFPDYNVRFIAIYDNVDSECGDNEFAPFKNIFNEWYARDTSRKVRAVIQSKGRSGCILSPIPPYGYVKDPDNKNHWLIDEDAAEIVKTIFDMYLNGTGTNLIANYLNDNNVPTPAQYAAEKGLRCRRPANPDTKWKGQNIHTIICHREYCGDVVNFKSTKKSYKSKKTVPNPEEKQVVLAGINDGIISYEDWVRAKEILESHRRVPTVREPDIFQGRIFCEECKSKMYLSRRDGRKPPFYFCSGYRKRQNICSSEHYFNRELLYCLVKNSVQSLIDSANLDKRKFAAELHKKMSDSANKEIKGVFKEKEKLLARYNALDKMIQKLYEDRAMQVISDERYFTMSTSFEKEQAEIKDKLTGLQKVIDEHDSEKKSIDDFIALVYRYSRVTELTPDILNEFVEKIIVYKHDSGEECVENTIDIYYRGIGLLKCDDVGT